MEYDGRIVYLTEIGGKSYHIGKARNIARRWLPSRQSHASATEFDRHAYRFRDPHHAPYALINEMLGTHRFLPTAPTKMRPSLVTETSRSLTFDRHSYTLSLIHISEPTRPEPI
eukprot:5141344-Pyramimonas_sp.AAC.1